MNPAPTTTRKLVVVAGSGRSGTSLFTGLSSRLGLYVPKPEVKANKSNPRGFSEPRWAVDFNHALLKKLSVLVDDARPQAWETTGALAEDAGLRAELGGWLDEQFGHADRVIVKDPRLAWFLGLYRAAAADVGAEVRVASMLRDPAEVLKSRELAYGDKLGAVTRAAGWVNVMLTSEELTRGDGRAVVRYEDLLADWQPTMRQADDAIGLEIFDRATDEQVRSADELVDTSLRRSRSTLEELGIRGVVADLTRRTHEALGHLADEAGAEKPATLAELDALRAEYAAFHEDAVAVASSTIAAARRQARANTERRVRQELAEQQAEQARQRSLRARAARVIRGAKA